jgi:hypothetical protein
MGLPETTGGAMSARSESNAGRSVVGSALVVLLLSSVLVPLALAFRSVASATSAVAVANCHDSGAGSLRRAVDDAPAGATIGFAHSPRCSTITLASTIVIRHRVTIDGPGAVSMTVSGGDAVEAFRVDPGVTASITGLTVAHGQGPYGGGIDNNGVLTLADSRVTDNRAATGGGGIWSNGRLTVEHSMLTGNQCAYFGGGIYSGPRGTLKVLDSTLSGNSSVDNGVEDPEYAYGGAIYADGTATISGTSLTGNRTQSIGGGGGGGALYVGGAATVTDSTITGNSVKVIVAAIPGQGGGAILNSGSLDVVTSTISDNTTDVDGGGIDNGWHLHLQGSTVTGNTAPTGPDIYDSPGSTNS